MTEIPFIPIPSKKTVGLPMMVNIQQDLLKMEPLTSLMDGMLKVMKAKPL